MLQPDEVAEIIRRALESGQLRREDVEAAQREAAAHKPAQSYVFGPLLDWLVKQRKLTAAQVQMLKGTLQQAAIGETLPPLEAEQTSAHTGDALRQSDGRSERVNLDASDAELALGHTLDSGLEGPTPPSAAQSQFPVENWERYELVKLLGQGGMGAVYKARDRRLGRWVALKFIRGGDAQMTLRFLQEARAQSRIDHLGICKVYEVGEVAGKAYIAMQLIDGLTLQQAAEKLSLQEKVQLVKEVAEALHAAHQLGIIHRDIKPANIMLERVADGSEQLRLRPVVMDFGLAREASEGKGLTESGAVMGTPAYMSPEQARGDVRRLDCRTDVYSLGATLYDLLSGSPPFEDASVVNILLKVLNEDVAPLRQKLPNIPAALDTIVSKCLNKEATERYPTAQGLAEDLGRFLANQRIVGRKVSLWYRLQYRARRNKPLFALGVALLLSLLSLIGYGIRNRIQSVRKEEEARKQAELAKKLGQSVQDLEWMVRTAYGLPLHDTMKEKEMVRARMASIEKDLRAAGDFGVVLGHYVLGRGHLALHAWERAYAELKQAEALGFRDPELDYALGRVLGELYSKALDDARRSGDKSFVEKRRKELEQQYLQPALRYLQNSRQLETASASYVEALIDFYNNRFDSALQNAHAAQQQISWLYEAGKLEGDVFAARALQQKDRGDQEQAERNYQEAIRRYEQAAEIGRSDAQIHEAIAESWIRQEEMDMYQGKSPEKKMEQALTAADRALKAAPQESHGWTKKAFAVYFYSTFLGNQVAKDILITKLQEMISFGKQAIAVHGDDAHAYEIIGIGYQNLWKTAAGDAKTKESYFADSVSHLIKATAIDKRFSWAYNDLGTLYLNSAIGKIDKFENPTADLSTGINYLQEAIKIDPEYYIAHSAISGAHQIMAHWKVENGEDPGEDVRLAEESTIKVLAINDKFFYAHGNAALASKYQAIYSVDVGQPSLDAVNKSLKHLQELVKMNSSFASGFGDQSTAYSILALQQLEKSLDPTSAVQSGLDTVDRCLQLEKNNAACAGAKANLLSVAIAWKARGKPPLAEDMAQCAALAREAVRGADGDSEILLSAVDALLRVAQVRRAHHLPFATEVAAGLEAEQVILKSAPGWPRALALQAALLVLQASASTPVQLREQSLVQARDSFVLAFAGNPLLRNRYGAVAAEAAGPSSK